jgi:hypothetical protein
MRDAHVCQHVRDHARTGVRESNQIITKRVEPCTVGQASIDVFSLFFIIKNYGKVTMRVVAIRTHEKPLYFRKAK